MKIFSFFCAFGKFFATLFVVSCLSNSAFAAFGLSSTADFFTVDTGAGLIFKVRRTDNRSSTQSAGDIASILFNNVEYQNQIRGSQINSGLDWVYKETSAVSVNASVINTDYIKVTARVGNLTHYYLARNGYPHIYMATYFTSEPQLGHVRYILRLNGTLLPHGPTPSDIAKTVSTVESGDIFALPNGETRSKHYSNMRVKDWQYIGATGTRVGMWVVRDNYEGGSSGPFYRSLLNQHGGDQEITYIMNYGEANTEPFRMGVLNSYTFVATTGEAPGNTIDTRWFADMGLTGYVSAAGRGRVAGVGINGRVSGFNYTVGFANPRAQYWTDVGPTGRFSCSGMIPGTYTMTTYKNELAVDTRSATVTAGENTVVHSFAITGDPASSASIWRIGYWDGSPQEFLNGDKLTTMHPSDVRISTWNPSNFIVGTSTNADFPAYVWKDINNDRVIHFKLTAAQRAVGHTLRIGLTTAFSGARPKISVNSWASGNPSASNQPTSRTLTVGTYRGNNVTYSYDIPANAWKKTDSEWNTLIVSAISGSGGGGYLSASFSVDALDLLQ